MNVWTDFVNWLTSTQGSRLVTDAILPFLAIVVAGVVAALIARSTGNRLLALHEREAAGASVTSVIAAARKAAAWATLGDPEREFAAHLADEATVRLRLLPVPGAGQAAAWAEHEIVTIRSNAGTFTFQAEQTYADLRDRLIEWQAKPARARKLFRSDLERWKVEEDAVTAGDSGAAGAAGANVAVDAPASSLPSDDVVAVEPATSAVPPTATAVTAGSTATHTSAAVPARALDDSTPASPSDGVAPGAPVSDAAASEATVAGASRSGDRDDEPTDTEATAFSAPVSAGQVRRRTTPDAG